MTKWSTEQLKAIETRNKSILVSAAAGSGKTAVLVERILGLVLLENIPIDKILVVTFTNAAAEEMKERIVKEIRKKIGTTEDTRTINILREQLNKIYSANISTFHAFSLNVIRRYYHLVDIEPNFSICDEQMSVILKNSAIDKVFEEYFEEDNTEFLQLVKSYSSIKNINGLKEALVNTHGSIQSILDQEKWLQESMKNYALTLEEFLNSKFADFILEETKAKLIEGKEKLEIVDRLLFDKKLYKLQEKNKHDIDKMDSILKAISLDDLETTSQQIRGLQFEQMRASKEEKKEFETTLKVQVSAVRDSMKKSIKKLKENYFYVSPEAMVETLNDTYGSVEMITNILRRFHTVYLEEKREKNLLDFNDIEHLTVEILDNPQVQKEYRDKFEYIFVDEYQDTNAIQEKIINSIERTDNSFRVGDIKQCIYGFRMADPSIFKAKYKDYKDEAKEENCKIDLNQNFRSKGTVIDGINNVFETLIDGYDEDAMLYQGLEKKMGYEVPVEVHYYDSAKMPGDEENVAGKNEELSKNTVTENEQLPQNTVTENEVDEEIEEMKAAEIEGIIVGKLIKASLGTTIYDDKASKERPLTQKDIVILLRSKKGKAEIFQKALENNGIDAYVDDKSGYFDTLEILTFTEILNVIDNKTRDISLLSLLRSPLFNFSVNQMVQLRQMGKEQSFYKNIADYFRDGTDATLKEKCKQVIDFIKKWKKESKIKKIDQLAWDIMIESGYYNFVGAMSGGVKRQANLRAFVDRATLFIKNGQGDINGFLKYIDILKKRAVDMGQVSLINEGDDVVRIMTIHKSKGLEFPMVIVPQLGRKLKFRGRQQSIEINREFGIGIKNINEDGHYKKHTIIEKIVNSQNLKQALEEEMRVYYVAFTRAKDKLALVGTVKGISKVEEKYDFGILEKDSMIETLYGLKEKTMFKTAYNTKKNISEYYVSKKETQKEGANLLECIGREENNDDELYEEIHRRLSFTYPNQGQLETKSKYSVSQLNGKEAYQYTGLEYPKFVEQKDMNTGAKKGTVTHILMEKLDFKRGSQLGADYVQGTISALVEEHFITKEESQLISVDDIMSFIKSNICERMIKSSRVEKEREFTITHNLKGETVLIQGIIDCYFIEGDEIVLVDYKTNWAVKNITDEYKEQMSLYKRALEINEKKKVKEAYLYLFSKNEAVKVEI